jgi:hypothetical protein
MQHIDRESPPRPTSKKPIDASTEYVGAELDVQKALNRLVEHANEARRSGAVRPGDMRETANMLRMYADALDSIADTRGVTDDALDQMIEEYNG